MAESSTPQHELYQGPTDPPVAVDGGVDRLELGVCQRRLDDCRQIVAVAEGAEVGEEGGDVVFGCGTNDAEQGL